MILQPEILYFNFKLLESFQADILDRLLVMVQLIPFMDAPKILDAFCYRKVHINHFNHKAVGG